MRNKTSKFLMAVAVLLSAMQSCDNAEDQLVKNQTAEIQNQTGIGTSNYGKVDLTFVGGPKGESLQKAYLASNISDVYFQEGESISVFDGQDNNEFVAKNGGATAEFGGKAFVVDTYYMLSPYQKGASLQGGKIVATVPLQQTAVSNNFDPEACVSVAKCNNGQSFELLNVGGLARIETTEPFAKIVLKAIGKETISGKVSANPETAESTVLEGDYVVSLLPGEGSSEISAGVYFLAVLPGTLSQGAQLEFYSSDNSVKTKTFASQITITKSKGINFGKISSYDEEDDEEEPMTLAKATTPQEVFKAMGLGWNLGNQFDSDGNPTNNIYWYPGEDNYGNPKTTADLFKKLKEAGVKTVRIPVTWYPRITWDSYLQGRSNYIIRQDWLNRVHEVVGYAHTAGLNVIINMHHDGGAYVVKLEDDVWEYHPHWLDILSASRDENVNREIKAQIEKFWTQIANEFKEEDNYLIFEGFNEIHDGHWGYGPNDKNSQYSVLNEWNQLFVNTVRNTGGNNVDRWLAVPGYVTNPELTVNYLSLPVDPAQKLMVSIHYYQPTTFSLDLEQVVWGQYSNGHAGWGNEDFAESTMQSVYNRFVSQGIPVYVGEIGCTNRGNETDELYREYYLEYCCRVLHNNYMAPILWDNGIADKNKDGGYKETHGYFDHATGEWMNQYSKRVIDIMKLAVESNDPSYTLDYIKNQKNPALGYQGN